MTHVARERSRTIVLLALATVLLAGCPKSPTPGGAAGAGLGPGGSSAGGAGGAGGAGSGGSAGSAGSAMGSAGGGAAGAQGAGGAGGGMAGGTGGTGGTTIPALPPPTDFSNATSLRDVQFEFDRSDILPSGKAILDANARWLKSHGRAQVLIQGHCDERGTNEYNLALGERRARATRDYLAATGIAETRMTMVSYGEERPLCGDRTEACWTQNRRAHFLVKE